MVVCSFALELLKKNRNDFAYLKKVRKMPYLIVNDYFTFKKHCDGIKLTFNSSNHQKTWIRIHCKKCETCKEEEKRAIQIPTFNPNNFIDETKRNH